MTETDHIRAAARTIAAERLRQPVDPWAAVAAHVATTEADADAIEAELARIADTLKATPESSAKAQIEQTLVAMHATGDVETYHAADEPAATLAQIAAEDTQLRADLAAGRVADRLGDPPPTAPARTIADGKPFRWNPAENCYCGGPEEIYPHQHGTGHYCRRKVNRTGG